MNIILANSPVNNGNRGCVALSISCMLLIKELLESHNIQANFYLPQSGFDNYGHKAINVTGFNCNYEAIMSVCNDSLKKVVKNIIKWKEYKYSVNCYKKADYVLDIGQGDSFADIYGENRFELINNSYRQARKFNKPTCILPQTIGPFDNSWIRKEAIKSIKNATCVMVRDKKSFDFVRQLLPQKTISEIIDVAFFLPYKKKQFNSIFTHVGLNVSGLLWNGGYTGDNQFGLICDYQRLVRSIIDFFLSLDYVELHLIPHVVHSERHIENDYAISYDLYEEYNNERLVLSPLFLDPIAAKGYISGMDFFMGARMHSTIGAFSSDVPVAPMAYSRKFNGLFVDTLDYNYMIDMKVDTNQIALEKIKQYFYNRDQEKAIIKERMNTVVKDRKNNLMIELSTFFNLNC